MRWNTDDKRILIVYLLVKYLQNNIMTLFLSMWFEPCLDYTKFSIFEYVFWNIPGLYKFSCTPNCSTKTASISKPSVKLEILIGFLQLEIQLHWRGVLIFVGVKGDGGHQDTSHWINEASLLWTHRVWSNNQRVCMAMHYVLCLYVAAVNLVFFVGLLTMGAG